jgi:hypothetical protein
MAVSNEFIGHPCYVSISWFVCSVKFPILTVAA